MRVLIMGLPGAGKTTIGREICKQGAARRLPVALYNADDIRKAHDDWDFSEEGRIRQAHRMREAADQMLDAINLCDFVAPLPEMRRIFAPDFTIWVDTIAEGRYEDTNKAFVPPEHYDLRVVTQKAEIWAEVALDLMERMRNDDV